MGERKKIPKKVYDALLLMFPYTRRAIGERIRRGDLEIAQAADKLKAALDKDKKKAKKIKQKLNGTNTSTVPN